MAVTVRQNQELITRTSNSSQNSYLRIERRDSKQEPVGSFTKAALLVSSFIPVLSWIVFQAFLEEQNKNYVTINYFTKEVVLADLNIVPTINTPTEPNQPLLKPLTWTDPNLVHVDLVKQKELENKKLMDRINRLIKESETLAKEIEVLQEKNRAHEKSEVTTKDQNGNIFQILQKQNAEIAKLKEMINTKTGENDTVSLNLINAKEIINGYKAEIQAYKDKISELNTQFGIQPEEATL